MVTVYNGNIVKCPYCGTYLEYSGSDILEEERGYGVGTYAGETYMAQYIICPHCNKKVDLW
jgi:DNA-directed RNA polymerase subunit RPC12/RpoP